MTTKQKKTKVKNSEETRNDILQAAIDVFEKRGFVRATLEQIATKARVTRGAVYWHFKNKQDIFEALHETLHKPVTALISEDMQKDSDDSLQQLERLCVKLLTDLDNDKIRKKILTIFLCKCDYSYKMEDILEKQRQKKIRNINFFAQYFERAKQRKKLSRAIDSKVAAISLACYMSGIVTEHLRNSQLFNLQKKAPMLISQFFLSFRRSISA